MRKVSLLMAALVPFVALPQDPYAAARAAMEASIQAQRAAVREQVRFVETASAEFFTVPWIDDPAVTATASLAPSPDCNPVPPEQMDLLLDEISTQEGVTPDLLRAVIEKESDFRPCAVSSKGAQGLMQLMPATASQFGVTDPFDPRQNVGAGARFLRQLLDRYGGNLSLALGAYNAGPARVDFSGGVPAISETLKYVFDIQEKLNQPESLAPSIDSILLPPLP